MNANDVMNQIETAWQLVNEGQLAQARRMSEKLVRGIANELEDHEADRELLHRLALACHVAGFTVNLSVGSAFAAAASRYFDEMLSTARGLRDLSLCVTALCYRGDCARRYGDPDKAKRTLQLAYRIGSVDPVAHGNSAQMLARLCGQEEQEQFRHLMKEAEQIAEKLLPSENSLPGQFCLSRLFMDACSYYRSIGKFEQGVSGTD